MILVIHAHPYPSRSRACRVLLDSIRAVPRLEVRSLYDLYPDFDIDINAEQAALERAQLVVWLHPLYWYTVPGLMKHWMDQVLVGGWAQGDAGQALKGKDCLWVTTTAGDGDSFTPAGEHGHPFEAFVPVVEQTARHCGMNWLPPMVVNGAHLVSEAVLLEAGDRLRWTLEARA
jgi:glutathione-regulated potassium-efflux system ancillary protein KefF